jgi:hypothetical protein
MPVPKLIPPIRNLAKEIAKENAKENTKDKEKIEVYDYNSLVSCLKANFEILYPFAKFNDPQDMIQNIVAEIQTFRIAEGLRLRGKTK